MTTFKQETGKRFYCKAFGKDFVKRLNVLVQSGMTNEGIQELVFQEKFTMPDGVRIPVKTIAYYTTPIRARIKRRKKRLADKMFGTSQATLPFPPTPVAPTSPPPAPEHRVSTEIFPAVLALEGPSAEAKLEVIKALVKE